MPQLMTHHVPLLISCLCACIAEPDASRSSSSVALEQVARASRHDTLDLLRRFEVDAPVTRGQIFGRPVLEELIAQGSSPWVWSLFGLDRADGREHLVFAPAEGHVSAFDRGALCPPTCLPNDGAPSAFDSGFPCPPVCPPEEATALRAFDTGFPCPPICPPEEASRVEAAAFDQGYPCPPICPPASNGAAGLRAEMVSQVLTSAGIARSGARITSAHARSLTTTYRKAHPTERAGVCFARSELRSLLTNPEVSGLWFFFGRRATGERALIIQPAASDGARLPIDHDGQDGQDGAFSVVATSQCDDLTLPSW